MYGPSSVTNYNTRPGPPFPPKKRNYLPIVILVMVFLFIAGGVIVLFVLSKMKKKTNIVRNGDFSQTNSDGTISDWAITEAWTLSKKGAVASSNLLTTDRRGGFYQTLTAYANKKIVVEFDISGYSGTGTVFLTTGSGLLGAVSENVSGNGHKKLTITLDGTDPVLAFVSQTQFAGTINNISAYVA